jgi:hypothetical protein
MDRNEAVSLWGLEEARARSLLERLQPKLTEARERAPSLVPGVGAGGQHTLEMLGYAEASDED